MVSSETANTDSDGKVSVEWTFGSTEGMQVLTINTFKTDGTTALTGSPITVNSTALPLTATDFDENVYNTVKINDQYWLDENLKSTHSADGSAISSYVYNSVQNNADVYGRLYSWYSAINGSTDVQGICPTGWHIPSDTELQTMIDYLGGDAVAGGKMKEVGTVHWDSPNEGADNSSNFSALPAGYYDPYININ